VPERFGYHEFAATLKEHNVNAKNIRLDYCPRQKIILKCKSNWFLLFISCFILALDKMDWMFS
jgi:hypothetical protein